MNGASLIAKNLPLQDQFNIIEDLMLAFCEKVALPCFLCRDANPDLYMKATPSRRRTKRLWR